MRSNFKEVKKQFIDEIKKNIKFIRDEIAIKTLKRLFEHSPHSRIMEQNDNSERIFGAGAYSLSWYDANFELTDIPISPGQESPTYNKAISYLYSVIQQIQDLKDKKWDEPIYIFNKSEHALNVELGMIDAMNKWPKTDAYFVFNNAFSDIVYYYRDLINKKVLTAKYHSQGPAILGIQKKLNINSNSESLYKTFNKD